MQNHKISLLIPVYNAPSVLDDMLASLENNTNHDLMYEILIGDDNSDDQTKKILKKFVGKTKFNVKLINREVNLGYLKNINDLYDQSKGDIVISLNTDILLPSKWLERIIQPFLTDKNIALATPFSNNASNLSILPNHGESWLDVDKCLSVLQPKYPNAYTAVGFCLAISKRLIDREKLFDESYIHGYCEETDLHYSVLSKGYKSIVVDNLLVYHAVGSSSFSSKHEPNKLNEILKYNRKIFDERWNSTHAKYEKIYLKTKPYNHLRFDSYHANFITKNKIINILFVLPNITNTSGGIEIVKEFNKYLTINNLASAIFCYGHIDQHYVDYHWGFCNPYKSFSQLKKNVSEINIVCATHYSSVELAEKISENYGSKLFYLVQGPENIFDSGVNSGKVIIDYQKDNFKLICVSDFLKYHLDIYSTNQSFRLSLGANIYQFYKSNDIIERESKSIAICLRGNISKGTSLALHAATIAKKAGFNIYFFGRDSKLFNLELGLGTNYGDLNPEEIRKLFNKVEYYLDFSYFEGLGLLPLEASNCGCIPILSNNGGSNFIFTANMNAFFVNIFSEIDFFNELCNKDFNQIKRMQENCLLLGNKYSLQIAKEEFLSFVQDNLNKSENQKSNDIEISKLSNNMYSISANSFVKRILRKIYNKYKIQINSLIHRYSKIFNYDISRKIDKLDQKLEKQQNVLNMLSKKMDQHDN